MGEVFLAWDERLERYVALKRVRDDLPGDERARARFRREARAVARLTHPSIVQVFELLEAEEGDVLVMEHVEGKGLHELIAEGGLDLASALRLAAEIADGLAEAHGKGLLHRDLKAENVRVTPSGHAKILDFGLARLLWSEGLEGESLAAAVTQPGALVGTVHAMSPEQASGRAVNHRSDLFALGSLLYQMLAGRPPFQGSNVLDTLHRVTSQEPPPITGLRDDLPAGLPDLIRALLAKDPADRPPNARMVADMLEELRAAAGTGTGPFPLPSPRTPPLPRTDALRGDADDLPTAELPSSASTETVVRALLMTDLVDSTKLVEVLGDARAAEVFLRHDRVARDLVARHDGLEIDKTDGFLVLFERPVDAVACALAYHRGLDALSDELDLRPRDGSAEEPLRLAARAAIHLGEVRLRRNPASDVARGAKPIEVEGLAKPMAARLMALAGTRQTLLTRSAFELARRSAVGDERWEGETSWKAHGHYLLKGVAEPAEVFEVGHTGFAPLVPPADSEKARRILSAELSGPHSADLAGLARSPAARRRTAVRAAAWTAGLLALVLLAAAWWFRSRPEKVSAPETSIAVLYFQNLKGDSDLDWMRRGIAESLTTALSGSPEIHVLASGRLYEILDGLNALEAPPSFEIIRRVAQRGRVGSIVRGNFTRIGDQLEINVSLETAQGEILKSAQARDHQDRFFLLVDELSAALRSHFEIATATETPVSVAMVTTESVEAWRYYTEGLALFHASKIQEAEPLLLKAVEVDPRFALAFADLGRIQRNLGKTAQTTASTRRAVELAEKLPPDRRYNIEGSYYESRWSTYRLAIQAFQDGLAFDPKRSIFRERLGLLHASLEQYDEAIAALGALSRDESLSLYSAYNAAFSYAALGQYESGQRVLDDFARRHDDWLLQIYLSWYALQWNDLPAAEAALERASSLRPDDIYVHYSRWRLEVLRQDWTQADAAAAAMTAKTGDPYARWRGSVSLARNLLYRGRSELALARLAEAASAYPAPDPSNAQARCWMAEVLLARGEAERALDEARQAREEGRGYWPELQAIFIAALAEETLGRSEAADASAAILEQRQREFPNAVEQRQILHLAGRRALLRGDATAAVLALRQAKNLLPPRGVEIHPYILPDHVQIWTALGEAEILAGDPGAAAEWLEKAWRSGTEHIEHPLPWVSAVFLLGRARRELGEENVTRRHFESFLDLWQDADFADAWVKEAREP